MQEAVNVVWSINPPQQLQTVSRSTGATVFNNELTPGVTAEAPQSLRRPEVTQSSTEIILNVSGGDGDQADLCLVTRQLIQWYIL